MTTREDVVAKALSFDGAYNGDGYDCSNQFSADLGRAREAWCGDFVTDVYRLADLALPSMQPGEVTGASYVPDIYAYGVRHGALREPAHAEPGDLAIFCWPGGNPDGDHVEMVIRWENEVLRTIGGNSGPSNVDRFRGVGGVHRHDWTTPNGLIRTTVNAEHLVHFGGDPVKVPVAPPRFNVARTLTLKSPYLRGEDVKSLQAALNHELRHQVHAELKVDGVFGPATRTALVTYQRLNSDPFGVCGAHTRAELHLHGR